MGNGSKQSSDVTQTILDQKCFAVRFSVKCGTKHTDSMVLCSCSCIARGTSAGPRHGGNSLGINCRHAASKA